MTPTHLAYMDWEGAHVKNAWPLKGSEIKRVDQVELVVVVVVLSLREVIFVAVGGVDMFLFPYLCVENGGCEFLYLRLGSSGVDPRSGVACVLLLEYLLTCRRACMLCRCLSTNLFSPTH